MLISVPELEKFEIATRDANAAFVAACPRTRKPRPCRVSADEAIPRLTPPGLRRFAESSRSTEATRYLPRVIVGFKSCWLIAQAPLSSTASRARSTRHIEIFS